jgi:hypothetical protein
MRGLELSRSALSTTVLGALLTACGGGSPVPIASENAIAASGLKHHQTFAYTGAKQTFIIPTGVTRLAVVARGGQGGGSSPSGPSLCYPGFPGRVYAVIRVRPGEKLYVFVGGSGYGDHAGGFNGGGAGGGGQYKGLGGGGGSDVRIGGDTLKNRVIVAAGGGGSGDASGYCEVSGGNGGGLAGQPGGSYPSRSPISGRGGGGGAQHAGGSGGAGGQGEKGHPDGTPGGNGALGLGGSGGNGGPRGKRDFSGNPGGGGGGGYYGGGGGGGSAATNYHYWTSGQGGGGGGGSSYVEPSAITSRMWTGWRASRNGQIILSW